MSFKIGSMKCVTMVENYGEGKRDLVSRYRTAENYIFLKILLKKKVLNLELLGKVEI